MVYTTSTIGSNRPASVLTDEAGSPEIEITPEMIEAGACVVACYSGREDDPFETAIEVFKAMLRVRII